MLDRKFIIDNAELVKQNCCRRGAKADVDRFVALDGRRKTLQSEVEELNRKANELSKSIGKAKDAADRDSLKAQGRDFRERTAELQAELTAIAAEQEAIHRSIPNISHPDAPVGADDQANLELYRGKTPLPAFDFRPLDHVELGERLDLVDFEGAPAWPDTASTSSRTRPSCWSWPWSVTPWRCCWPRASRP